VCRPIRRRPVRKATPNAGPADLTGFGTARGEGERWAGFLGSPPPGWRVMRGRFRMFVKLGRKLRLRDVFRASRRMMAGDSTGLLCCAKKAGSARGQKDSAKSQRLGHVHV